MIRSAQPSIVSPVTYFLGTVLLIGAVIYGVVFAKPQVIEEARQAGHDAGRAAGFSAAVQHADIDPLIVHLLMLEKGSFSPGEKTKVTIVYDRAEGCSNVRYIPVVFDGPESLYYLQPTGTGDAHKAGTREAAVLPITFQTSQTAPLLPGVYDLSIMVRAKCPGHEEKTTFSPRESISIRN